MVQAGLSILLGERMNLLAGKRVGLISHTASVLPDLTGIVEALRGGGAALAALFGAEHGFAGVALAGAVVGNAIDPRTGLPVYSLYGEVKAPTPEMLAGLDVLVLDFQDAGVRFYTFLSTLYYVLESAGKAGMPVVILDRPNPINGLKIEGPTIQTGYESFVGIIPVPARHGMTLAELALLMNEEYHLHAPLTVVPMRGWSRAMWFDQTGLPWVTPSPAMPHLSTATVYPGICFFEGTNLSEGRGTALPFEVIGAPWIDGYALAEQLNKLTLPGVRFRPHGFKVTASKYAGEVCSGVQVHVVDREAFNAVQTGIHMVAVCRAMYPKIFSFLSSGDRHSHFDLLAGSARVREQLEASVPVEEMKAEWSGDCEAFARLRAPYLLYQ